MILVRTTFVLSIAWVLSMPPGHAQSRTESLLQECVALSNPEQRLACFDAAALELGFATETVVEPETPAVPAATAAATAAASSEPALPAVPDDLGQPSEDSADEDALEYQARVTKCEQGSASNRYFFFFENGQVWKQSNTGRLRLDDCDFDATLTKDVFGYKMRIESENKTVRVSRVR